jgi:hypothetical protein
MRIGSTKEVLELQAVERALAEARGSYCWAQYIRILDVELDYWLLPRLP